MTIDFNSPLNSSNNMGTSKSTAKKEPSSPLPTGAQDSSPKASDSEKAAVSLTESATQLKALESQIKQQPDVDQARVDRIKRAIADGSFEMNTERTAEKMLDMEIHLNNG